MLEERLVRSIAVDAADFYYFDEGQPTRGTVLLLHGFPDTPRSFTALADQLVDRGYRVLRPFLPGYAPSRWHGPFDVGSVSARLLHFIEAVNAGPVHLVGHDWGAILSYAMLYRRPECFAVSAAISVPHPLFIAHPKQLRLRQLQRSSYILLFQLRRIPEALVRSSRARLVARLWRQWSPSFVPPADMIEEIERCLQASGSAPFAYYRNLFQSLRAGAGNFGEIGVPLLYVHGVEDGCIGARYATGHERYFTKGYELALLQGVGHFIAAEAPRRLGQVLESWFQGPQ